MSLPRAALLGCMLSLAVSLTVPAPARAEVTLLIPSRTFIDVPAEKKGTEPQAAKAPAAKEAKNTADSGKEAPAEAAGEENKAQAAAQPAPPPLNAEVDMLISLMRPREHAAQPMDMPQLFAVLRHDAGTRFVNGTPQPERRDLLGDMEESLYLDTKAWGANVAIDQPGLYQFITETRPRLNVERQCFEQQYVKSILPVCGVEEGWERPAGLRWVPVLRGRTPPVRGDGADQHAVPRSHSFDRAAHIVHHADGFVTERQVLPRPDSAVDRVGIRCADQSAGRADDGIARTWPRYGSLADASAA